MTNRCRFCETEMTTQFVDLGVTPLCQKHVTPEDFHKMEKFYPLIALVCHECWLVQLIDFEAPDAIFTEDYAYFSSYSDSWLDHARRYVDDTVRRFSITRDSLVAELASNDGYLLQYFDAQNVPVLGIEPSGNVADAAITKGIRTEKRFFGQETAQEMRDKYGPADLIIGNNVLAHVPDINDFVGGMKTFLAKGGFITMEFPHLQKLIEQNQFDTIYHEHFSYLSLTAVSTIFAAHGLEIFDVKELPTHGGSLRIYAKHDGDSAHDVQEVVSDILEREETLGFKTREFYENFDESVRATKRNLLQFLIEAKRDGKSIAGYGAPGKGNTLLNYCGIKTDIIDYTVDRNPHKQNNFLPGSRIPICAPDKIAETKPDYILILPWNLKDEITSQMAYVREWGGEFVVPIPIVQRVAAP